ncbi:TonB-dependent receptor domain-containing protein [Flavobacterium kingsejongi]|uniref:TonB-dependent receptor n=1 Tax=Flavobacterium kingsejongi TaxID=1678728 RepID=A0A2S1LP42_9FLAO|nr:outer membrane beta-barrel family protein [Flavobacterium kingsejongi]AWG25441.1 TonB-dependent receptor [Flavobacterium kingsejongi]
MKLKLLLLLVFSAVFSVNAQNTGSISGTVTEKATKAPIGYATIEIREVNSTKIVGGGITEENGNFKITGLAPKNYTIQIQYIGFKPYSANANLETGDKNVTLKVILEEEATQLQDVNVVAERSTIEQKIDRKVINVGRDLTTAGATASEIMNNIPSVNVDQDGKLSLRGNQNVRVLIDGRPSNVDPAQLLKQIPSSSIKKIELITNPSAKYNPEGMSGIINIVLHKNTNDGFNGNLNAGITFGDTPKYNNSLDMNYRTGKVNFFGNGGKNFGKYFNGGQIERLDNNMVQDLKIVNDNDSYLYKLGMDFYIDDKNTISVYTNQNAISGLSEIGTNINYRNGDRSNIRQFATYDTDGRNGSYNLAYKHLFEKEGHTLDFEGNFNDYKQTQNANFDTDPNTGSDVEPNILYQDNIKDIRKNTTMNLDYVNPLSEKSTLELGAEARITRTTNDYLTGNPGIAVENRISNYTYDIDIYSAYATFGQKFEKFSYQLGARFESYKVQANLNYGQKTFEDDYMTVYPSAYFTYNLNEKNMFQLSYSRRVDRPSLEQTKPIREFSTPLVTSLGNTELEPQFTNSVEVNYTKTFSKGSFTTGVYVRSINNEISRTLYPDDSDPTNQKQIMSYTNFSNNTAYGFEVSANYKITKWWDVQPSVDFSSINQKGIVFVLDPVTGDSQPMNKKVDVAAFNTRINSNFKATKQLSFLLFGFYRGPVDGIQNNSKEMYKIDAGGRYAMLNNKLTFSVRFNDIFDTMRYAFDAQNPYPQTGQFTWESHSVYFGLNYLFGGGKNRALQRKQREDNTKQGSGGMF